MAIIIDDLRTDITKEEMDSYWEAVKKKRMDKIDNLISIGEAILQILTEKKAKEEMPLNRQQAAYYLGVNPHTIDNYRRSGRLKKCVRHGMEGYLASDLDKCK